MAIEHLGDLEDPRLADYVHLREPSRRMGLERDRGIFTVEGWLSLEAYSTQRRFPLATQAGPACSSLARPEKK